MSNIREKVRQSIKVNGNSFSFWNLQALVEVGLLQSVDGLSRLPYSLRVLLESVLRNADGHVYLESHVEQLAHWQKREERHEIPFMPARVVLQDFTGVPAVVDLAALRDAVAARGGDPRQVNPLVPCDLVIDHSVQVDFAGDATALGRNEEIEFTRNQERYRLLKWAQSAFTNFRVVPPAMGIVHQVNLEYLSSVAFVDASSSIVYPDSCVGTDSHTTMTNGLGVLSWGVGGIEAEAVMLGQPIYMLVPDVIGIKLSGKLPEGSTATDLVLFVTELCRKIGVVGKFVEFCGPGLASLSLADRATISNMAPEQGSTVSYFPVDSETLRYLRLSGRSEQSVKLVENYYRAQGMFLDSDLVNSSYALPEFTELVELDLGEIRPCVAGPKRPHDKQLLSEVSANFCKSLTAPVGPKGFGLASAEQTPAQIEYEDKSVEELNHGSVVIAAITSCTNTSNPSVVLAAGILAKKAVERGLRVPRYVKASLAPGSRVVTDYLTRAGLLPYLEKLGFYVVGYGCTTCIGNSGPLSPEVTKAIQDSDLVAAAVLSGNRNFEGRVSPLTRANFLASPPLVVAYALFGSVARDLVSCPIGLDQRPEHYGKPVYLRDIWPSDEEISAALNDAIDAEMFYAQYSRIWEGSKTWQEIEAGAGVLYPWDTASTYIQKPPFFINPSLPSAGVDKENVVPAITNARVLGKFGDSVTTDHISPAGSIHKNSPAGRFLTEAGVAREDWNSYGSRRGNHYVMERGTFANTRLRNLLVPNSEGNVTVHFPTGHSTTGEQMSFFEAADLYLKEGTPLIILAGKEYGSGSSRDWAAKGPYLQGIKAVIAQSFERIHRSNLIGMGIIPLQFLPNQSPESLGLLGSECFDIFFDGALEPQQIVRVVAKGEKSVTEFKVQSRIDTPIEVEYYLAGGILHFVLNKITQ